MINKKAFLAFKQRALNAVGYENEDQHEKNKVKEKDGSTSVYYEKGLWKYHDNYFGGEPYGGREVIFYEGKALHITVYYGWVDKKVDVDLVYGFLRQALQTNKNPETPRGPLKFQLRNNFYQNKYEGTIECFQGKELIYQNKKLIYTAVYAGGLIDQRRFN